MFEKVIFHSREKGELSGRGLDSRQRGHGFEPHRGHYVVSLSKDTSLCP